MGLLLFLGVCLLIYWLMGRSSDKSANPIIPQDDLSRRNVEWAEFIAGYSVVVKTKSEKQLLVRMLQDIKEQSLVPEYVADESSVGNIYHRRSSLPATEV